MVDIPVTIHVPRTCTWYLYWHQNPFTDQYLHLHAILRAVYPLRCRDGKRHGRGTYTGADGLKYTGEFNMGVQHGRGVQLPLPLPLPLRLSISAALILERRSKRNRTALNTMATFGTAIGPERES